MDAELKAKWVAKLRSGEVKQTVTYLKDAKGYCCIGVLCEVVRGSHVWLDKSFISNNGCGYLFEDKSIVTEAGVPYGVGNALIAMNDGGSSFAQIADYIEANL